MLSAAAMSTAGVTAGRLWVKNYLSSIETWNRPSYTGRTVSLSEGALAGMGMLAGAATLPPSQAVGALTALASAWGAGFVDDHLEEKFPARGKGFHGHLGALKKGKLTSGVAKIAVIGMGSLAGTAAIPRSGSARSQALTWIGQASLVAGFANLINLLDLRPGRALKVSACVGVPMMVSRNEVVASLGTTAGVVSLLCASDDLAGETMLGDTGANVVGAGLGFAVASSRHASVRWTGLGLIVALTLASERVSFSRVIAEHPVLRSIDEFGRK